MKQTVDENSFIDAFARVGRKDQFSYEALQALYGYLTELEEDCGTEMELDPIGLCCEWAEHDSALAAALEYSNSFETLEGEDDDEAEERALEWLRDETQVIEFKGGIVIAQF